MKLIGDAFGRAAKAKPDMVEYHMQPARATVAKMCAQIQVFTAEILEGKASGSTALVAAASSVDSIAGGRGGTGLGGVAVALPEGSVASVPASVVPGQPVRPLVAASRAPMMGVHRS